MNEIFAASATFGVVISILAYAIGMFLNKKLRHPLANPLLISIVIVMAVLGVFKIDYEVYSSSAKYLGYLLTPATVSLSIPLYHQIKLLKSNFPAIMAGILSGVFTSFLSILGFSLLFGFSKAEYITLIPKSITTAIGMVISDELGGFATITVAAIMVTGLAGNILADTVLKVFKIKSPIAKGLAIGTSAHALGTVKALEMGEVEGAMSSLSIVVAGLMTSILAPLFIALY